MYLLDIDLLVLGQVGLRNDIKSPWEIFPTGILYHFSIQLVQVPKDLCLINTRAPDVIAN